MGKALVIAEKPSVASDISKALGKFKKDKDFFENDEYVISSAVGHLLQIALPDDFDKKKRKWSFDSLPMIPDHFALNPIERSEARYKVLQKLLKRKDIDTVINACDAGREGELIFRYIIKATNTNKPTKRLWLQSIAPDSIRQGFASLVDGDQMIPLAEAATSRSESDWIVGINGTRALTAFNSKHGGFQLTTVGRVQTPTLTLVVEREDKIKNFTPRPYWEVYGNFDYQGHGYEGKWFDETFKKPKADAKDDSATVDLKADRIWFEHDAQKVVDECKGKPGTVTEEKKPSTQLSPLLFDLTSLQRECNARFGLSASRTLQLAQALYERHKVITYPRTDSKYLPDDYVNTVKNTLKNLNHQPAYDKFAGEILKNSWVFPTKRVFNQAKVSDHFAIIPTLDGEPKALNEFEQKVYDTIVRRFLAVFFPAAVYELTTRITRILQHAFKTEGKILKELGWLAVYGRGLAENDDKEVILTEIPENSKVDTTNVEKRELLTRPPARFSEATLLSAMESAGKLVDDDELREAMEEKGLGTPATRAAIIETLIHENYIVREGRELIPTPKAFDLFNTLKAMEIPGLTSPEMTGEWEYKLKLIEQKKLTRAAFMDEIRAHTIDLVDKVKGFDEDKWQVHETDIIDPFTQTPMLEALREFRSKDGQLVIRKSIAGRVLEHAEVKELLEKKFLGPLSGFRSRQGWPFQASLKLNDEKKVEFVFENTADTDPNSAQNQFVGEPLGKCPICGAEMHETLNAYICEKNLGEAPSCMFKVSKKILSQDISRDEVKKILTEGKSSLLTGFKSNRTHRFFKANLIVKEGKVTFDFPPRPEGAKGRKPSARDYAKSKKAAEGQTEGEEGAASAEKPAKGSKAKAPKKKASVKKPKKSEAPPAEDETSS